MFTRNDCLSILVKLESEGLDINAPLKKTLVNKEVPLDVLQFIAKHRGLEVANFYDMLRKNYNKKHAPVYINIVKETDDSDKIISTLTALLLQIVLYSNKLESELEATKFLTQIRAEEISRVLHDYFINFDITPCKTLLTLIKSDLVVLEYIAGRREISN